MQGTAFFYSQARNAERIASILNDTAYSVKMSQLALNVASAFLEYFISTGPNGSVVIGDGSLDVTCWAYFLGLVPRAQEVCLVSKSHQVDASFSCALFQVAVADSIRAAIIANGTHMFTGNLATSFIFRRGVHSGLSDEIYGSLAQVCENGRIVG